MLAVENNLKQAGVVRTYRPQSTILPLSFDPLANAVQQPIRRCAQSYYGKGSQIAGVGGVAELRAAPDIGNPFAQWQPFQHQLTLVQPFAPYSETCGVVNGGLNPQHAALLVVHFDRVLFNPVFHPNTFQPSFQITANLTGETLVSATLQKAHYFFAAKLKHGMSQQQRIKLSQTTGTAKHYIGGIFHLPYAPEVASDIQAGARVDPGIYFVGQSIQKPLPVTCRQTIHQALRLLQVRDLRETVVALDVADASPLQLLRQPLATVDTNLNSERQPGLQAHVHQAKLAVQIVKVKVQALTFFRHQFQLLRGPVLPQIEGLARFDTGKHTYQPLLDAVPLHDLQCQFLFRSFRRGQINIRSPHFARQLFRVCHQPLRQTYYVAAKILQQHMMAVQKNLEPLNMRYRTQGAAKQHAIKSRKCSSYAVAVPLQKTLHDSPPVVRLLLQTDHARKGVIERSSFC